MTTQPTGALTDIVRRPKHDSEVQVVAFRIMLQFIYERTLEESRNNVACSVDPNAPRSGEQH